MDLKGGLDQRQMGMVANETSHHSKK